MLDQFKNIYDQIIVSSPNSFLNAKPSWQFAAVIAVMIQRKRDGKENENVKRVEDYETYDSVLYSSKSSATQTSFSKFSPFVQAYPSAYNDAEQAGLCFTFKAEKGYTSADLDYIKKLFQQLSQKYGEIKIVSDNNGDVSYLVSDSAMKNINSWLSGPTSTNYQEMCEAASGKTNPYFFTDKLTPTSNDSASSNPSDSKQKKPEQVPGVEERDGCVIS
jgi:hypothetical protein